MQIADGMARIETSLERNIYWAFEGNDRLAYLKERMADNMHYLLWDINAYTCHVNIFDEEREKIGTVCQSIKALMKESLDIE